MKLALIRTSDRETFLIKVSDTTTATDLLCASYTDLHWRLDASNDDFYDIINGRSGWLKHSDLPEPCNIPFGFNGVNRAVILSENAIAALPDAITSHIFKLPAATTHRKSVWVVATTLNGNIFFARLTPGSSAITVNDAERYQLCVTHVIYVIGCDEYDSSSDFLFNVGYGELQAMKLTKVDKVNPPDNVFTVTDFASCNLAYMTMVEARSIECNR